MTWFKVDDSFSSHPKVMALPRGATRLRAIGLWTALGSWCARQLTDGRFARHMVAEHGGTTADARNLVDVGLWVTTDDGYAFHNWEDWQPTRAKVEQDREEAKERMRRVRSNRTGSAGVRANTDRSSATPSRPVPSTAAAAAADTSGVIDVLRTKLQAHTPLRGLRFDTLRPEQVTQLEALVEIHGDGPLVAIAVDTLRHPVPTHASAFLGTWASLPPPGQRLHAVRQTLCDTHSTPLSPSGTCSSCAADQRAAR